MRGQLATVACAATLLAVFAVPAHAEPVVVMGTVDVRDSGLLEQQIVADFEREHDDIDLKYLAVGSTRAISGARTGSADAILVNAPSLEDEFLRDGLSAESSGRAVFYNDHVLVGPALDPAGVAAAAPHNAARAFELIAQAGAGNRAYFISRGDGDGTNVAEHRIWTLIDVPRNDNDEPGSGASTVPAWYQRAGVGQSDTVLRADRCELPGGGCYALTDRATFERLKREDRIKQLQIVAEVNDADARGGSGLLVNPYHAYAVNPREVAGVNSDGAQAFLDFVTERTFQRELDSFPNRDNPAFRPDARPTFNITSPAGERLPTKVDADATQVVRGRLGHEQPAFGPLEGSPMFVQRIVDGDEFVQLADDRTDGQGDYELRFRPTRTGSYRLYFRGAVDLRPDVRKLGRVKVRAVVTLNGTRALTGGVRLRGQAFPDRDRAGARLVVLGRRGGQGRYRRVGTVDLRDTGRSFVTNVKLDRGTWQLRVRYEDPGAVTPGSSQPLSVSVR